jgi:RimJ/RimL family protein N-acetyltransferase
MVKSGEEILVDIKNKSTCNDPCLLLDIPGFLGYFIRPIPTHIDSLDEHDIHCLTCWRNSNRKAFLNEFIATEKRTANWLSDVVHNDKGRILCMIINEKNLPIGYMGLAYIDWSSSYGEADSIVRGRSSPKGLMSSGLLTIMNWAQRELGLKTIGVRVLSDNPALAFYRKLGFRETKRVGLIAQRKIDGVSWIEDTSVSNTSRYLVHHVWQKSSKKNE